MAERALSNQELQRPADDTGAQPVSFPAELSARLAGYGANPFIEFESTWYTGNDITGYIATVDAQLERAGVGRAEPVGVVVRNRVAHAAAVLGFIAAGRSVVMINCYQSARAMADDIGRLRLRAVIADEQDWAAPVTAACADIGGAGIALTSRPLSAEIVSAFEPRKGIAPDAAVQTPGLHILTSGTTGPPKRVPVPMAALHHTVLSMTGGQRATEGDPPELAYWPFGSVGVCQLLAAPYRGTRMILLEKFTVAEWVRAVKTYRIKRAGVQPAIVRMLLDADVPPGDLASLEYLPGGSGPLEPSLRDEFERRYRIPLLWAYGATEFAGSVCAWTPELHRHYGAAKSGTVGKPLPGVDVRITDADTGNEVTTGEHGFLEAKVAALGADWIRTTDLASVDEDGFVTVHGRADGAINRGGFKILPETVRAVLLEHPAVRDACVVGVPDRRLGRVPFAAVETRADAEPPAEEALCDLVRDALPSHHVPVAVAVCDRLPRNAAWKVAVAEVAALYDAQ